MLPLLQHNKLIPNRDPPLLTINARTIPTTPPLSTGPAKQRTHLRAQNAVTLSAAINLSDSSQCSIWFFAFGTEVFFTRCLVDVGELAARGAAGDGVFVEADFNFLPGVFGVRGWAGD